MTTATEGRRARPRMHYLEFLARLHERLAPRTYLEIGVASGHSLALSACRSIGVDPDFTVDQELRAPVSLRRCTSDEYFAELDSNPDAPFAELPIDFAYVDGMHRFEYALRDFIGLERRCGASSVIAFDDMLPRNVEETARERETWPWTGDVFRIRFALAQHRPDLKLTLVDTEPTGTLVVYQLDPSNRALSERLDDIVREYVHPDPQPVPEGVLGRAGALTPRRALSLKVWDRLREARGGKEVQSGDGQGL